MPSGGKQTDLNPGVVARIAQGARYVLSGVVPDAWFGPMQPLQPMAPEGVEGRRYDYPVGINLDTRPRGSNPVGFSDLRALADNCDILRSVIETRKDQMEAMDWVIRPKMTGGKSQKASDDQRRRAEQVTEFFQSPDKVSTWSQWQRQLLEDRFVIDAAALYKRRDRKGRLYGLEVIDGATLKILIDASGRRPLPPDPAYQQILKGVPAVDYTAEEVLYLMRNPRSHKVYGYSEVEQIIVSVNIAIRRALFQLEYYREGSQPDAFLGLPKEWNAQQIVAFQEHFDAQMSGNLAARRKLKMVPGDAKYLEAKQPPLKDEYDEWLARIICHAFSISPQPFVKQMNRATADTAHDAALQEGLQPLQRWVKSFIDPVIVLDFGSPDLEFAWVDDREQDPMQADTILVNDTKAGIISIDEAREAKGLDPMGGAYAVPMVYTATGYAAIIDPEEQQARAEAAQEAARQQPGDDAKQGKDADDGHEHDAKKTAYTRLRKADRPKPIPFDRKVTREARKALTPKIAAMLKAAGKDVAGQIAGKLGKAEEDDRKKARQIAEDLDLSSLYSVTEFLPGELEGVLADSGERALAQIGVGDRGDLVDQVNDRAVMYAKDRAAEMVGKRWVDGELVDNPDARWRIDEATRDELQGIIEQGLAENLGSDAIADAIEDAGAFSEERAELIAHTEIARANSVGALDGYRTARDAGVRVKKEWLPDADPCEDCQENADAGPIDLDDEFPSGDTEPPGHPHCECAIMPVVEEEGGETDENDEEVE